MILAWGGWATGEGDRMFDGCGSACNGSWTDCLGGICGIFMVKLSKKSWECWGKHLWQPEDVGGGWNLEIGSLISSGSSISSLTTMSESPLIDCEISNRSIWGILLKYQYLQSLAHPVVHLMKFSSSNSSFSGVPATFEKDWLSFLWLVCKKFNAVWGCDHC